MLCIRILFFVRRLLCAHERARSHTVRVEARGNREHEKYQIVRGDGYEKRIFPINLMILDVQACARSLHSVHLWHIKLNWRIRVRFRSSIH